MVFFFFLFLGTYGDVSATPEHGGLLVAISSFSVLLLSLIGIGTDLSDSLLQSMFFYGQELREALSLTLKIKRFSGVNMR